MKFEFQIFSLKDFHRGGFFDRVPGETFLHPCTNKIFFAASRRSVPEGRFLSVLHTIFLKFHFSAKTKFQRK